MYTKKISARLACARIPAVKSSTKVALWQMAEIHVKTGGFSRLRRRDAEFPRTTKLQFAYKDRCARCSREDRCTHLGICRQTRHASVYAFRCGFNHP